MTDNTIVGAGRVKFLKPGEKYHWVRETQWERDWEAEGLLPKRRAVASEPVVVETYNAVVGDWCTVSEFLELVDISQKAIKAGTKND